MSPRQATARSTSLATDCPWCGTDHRDATRSDHERYHRQSEQTWRQLGDLMMADSDEAVWGNAA